MGQNMMPPPLKGGKGMGDHGSEGVLNPVLMGVHPDVGHKSRAMYFLSCLLTRFRIVLEFCQLLLHPNQNEPDDEGHKNCQHQFINHQFMIDFP